MLPTAVADRYSAAGYWPAHTCAQRAAEVVRARPGDVAVIDGDVRLDFATLAGRAAALARHLEALGVRRGDVVSWVLPNWWEAVAVHHAVLLAGAISNPVNPAFRERELSFVLDQAQPAVVVAAATWRGFAHAAAIRDLYDGPLLTARTGELDEVLAHAEPTAELPTGVSVDPASDAVLLYTSGTTSDPKGVRLSHRALLCEIASFESIHDLTPADRYLGGSPVSHVAGLVYAVMTPLALGTSSVLMDKWDAGRALDAIAREQVTFQTGPPTFLLTLADAYDGTTDISSFRLFSTGGASISTENVRHAGAVLGCLVKRAYGSTEVPTLTATNTDDGEDARLASDGRLIGGAEMRIVGAGGLDVRSGDEGEIWARAPEMLSGYRDESLHADAFAAEGWFRTGDLGVVDERGLLHVTGRIKDIIIRGGENISAKEIEDALATHPAVAECAVAGIPDERMGERVAAYLVPRAGADPSLEDLTAHLAAAGIAKHKWPETLEIRRSLPKTDSGKVRKNDLR
ncbi:MAG TPA: AMP-binding protein [Actinomycetota bacterium]|nr:AMP-binding protein [Actinomycetota bacterium]